MSRDIAVGLVGEQSGLENRKSDFVVGQQGVRFSDDTLSFGRFDDRKSASESAP